MAKIDFSTENIKALGPGEYLDDHCPGLRLRVGKDRKVWSVVARGPGGIRKRVTIGDFPKPFTFKKVKPYSEKILEEIKTGFDRREAARLKAKVPTFKEAAQEFIRDELPHRRNRRREPIKERSKKNIESSLRLIWKHNELGPGVANGRISWIGEPELLHMIKLHNRPRRGEPRPSAARARLDALAALFDWAVDAGYVLNNPVRLLPAKKIPAPAPPRKVKIEKEDRRAALVKLWESADELEGPLDDFMRVWLLCPLRRGEIQTLEWGDIDLPNRQICLPAERTKNGEEFILPLSQAAVEILGRRAQHTNSRYVFASNKDAQRPINSWTHYLKRLRKASGVPSVIWHDNRKLFLSLMTQDKFNFIILDALLNHAMSASVVGSARNYFEGETGEPHLRAMEHWSNVVRGIEQAGDNVTPIPMSA